jgi:hypothetical protein
MAKFRALHIVAVLALAAHAVGCQASYTRTVPPTGPTSPFPVKLEVTGPASVAPGATVAYTATAVLNDGTRQDATQKAGWTANPSSVLTISNPGQVTGHATGDATIKVSLLNCCAASITLLVLPPDTYRLVGTVLESNAPLYGATVTVLKGTGAGLSATTNGNGGYRLYGVAGPIQIKVSKPGYDDIVKTFTVTQNDTLDFPEAHQTAPIPSLAGSYTLTLTADPACLSGAPGLLFDFLQTPRNYSASITQDGPVLTVTLTDSSVLAGRNGFVGRVRPDGVDFTLGDGYFGYGVDDGVSEQISSTKVFTFGGFVSAAISGSSVAGTFNGTLEIFGMTSPGIFTSAGSCPSVQHRLTFTRMAQPARRR